MYILLGGVPPFAGDTEEEIFEKIKKCEYDFSPPPFKKVSKNCKDLIRRLLEPKKQYRIKANEALRHPFFTESFDPNSAMTENKDLNVLKRFINPVKYASKFHEAVVAYLCVNFIPDEEAPAPAEAASHILLREQLDEVLKTLTPREEKVLKLRFGLEDGRSKTLEEVGKEFNVTRERIRQIEAKALRKLRHPSRSKKLKDFLD